MQGGGICSPHLESDVNPPPPHPAILGTATLDTYDTQPPNLLHTPSPMPKCLKRKETLVASYYAKRATPRT